MAESKPGYTVLVATDDSAQARNAIDQAVSLAQKLGAKLYALYVIDSHAAERLGVHMREAIREMRGDGEEAVRYAVERAKEAGVEIEGVLAEGRPREEVCRVAADSDVDLVVVGAKGKSAIASMVLGSVSEYVIRHCRRPVLVVPGDGQK